MLKTAIIGLGSWGKKILPTLDKHSQVIRCSNNKNEKTRKWLEENFPHIEHTFDSNDILTEKEIEAVVISTPIDTHSELVRLALKAGKHVFVEKPLATSTKEIESLFALAKDQGLALVVGYIFTYHEVLDKLMKIVQNDRTINVLLNWEKFGTFREDIYWNLVCHELSIIYKLLDSNTKIIKSESLMRTTKNLDFSISIIHFERDCTCQIITNRISNNKRKYALIITESKKVYIWIDESLYLVDRKIGYQEICKNKNDNLQKEIKEFLDMIECGNLQYNMEMNVFITEVISELLNKP